MELHYQASACQDRFAANISSFKRDGFYLDIGSCDAMSCNNTYAFEGLGWKGICVELNNEHNESYAKRTCKYINADATKLDYSALLKEQSAPTVIDYLSLDIDEKSTDVLKVLPFSEYVFKVITIEHDFYIHSGRFRDEQRKILTDAGYVLLCADVLVPVSHDTKPNSSFEDWWIHNSFVDSSIEKLQSSYLYPIDIISKF